MNRLERWSMHLAAFATALTGLIYGWVRYYGQRMGEFGLEPHPWQGFVQHAHVLTGPVLLFLLGMAVKGHAMPALSARGAKDQAAGLALTLILTPMVLSGYALQVCTDLRWRTAIAWVHGPSALLFLLAYGAHLWMARRRALRTQPREVMIEIHSHP